MLHDRLRGVLSAPRSGVRRRVLIRRYRSIMLRSVDLDFDANEGDETSFLTVSSPEVLIQVSILPSDLARLAGVRDTDWSERRTVKAGTCAGRDVYWCASEPPAATIMTIGDDPETAQVSGEPLNEAALEQLLFLVRTFAR